MMRRDARERGERENAVEVDAGNVKREKTKIWGGS
jgi:hypothetical protein